MGSYLSRPATQKYSSDYENDRLCVGMSSMQGWYFRKEDAQNAILDFEEDSSFFAVYDGHEGKEVAMYCAEKFPHFFKDLSSYLKGDYQQALKNAFLDFDQSLLEPHIVELLNEIAGDKEGEEERHIQEMEAYYEQEFGSSDYFEQTPESIQTQRQDGLNRFQNYACVANIAQLEKVSNINKQNTTETVQRSEESTAQGGFEEDLKCGMNSPSLDEELEANLDSEDEFQNNNSLLKAANWNDDCREQPGLDKKVIFQDRPSDPSLPRSSNDDYTTDFTQFFSSASKEPGKASGCSAVICLLNGCDLYVANVGDCLCLVCRGGQVIELTSEHKPHIEEEYLRIIRAGGKVTLEGCINGGLNLSRSLGDHNYKMNFLLPPECQMVTASPSIRKLSLTPTDEFLVLVSKGISTVMKKDDIIAFIRIRLANGATNLSKICEELFDNCLAPNTLYDGIGCDNMTATIVKFKPILLKMSMKNHILEEENINLASLMCLLILLEFLKNILA